MDDTLKRWSGLNVTKRGDDTTIEVENSNMRILFDSQSTAPRRMRPVALILLAGLALPSVSAPNLNEETQELLVSAVTAAAELDLYNARCRGDQSGRQTDNLNKEMVGKLGITVLGVEDDLFPERSYRATQKRLERDFLAELRDAGGCPGAKESDLPEVLKARYYERLNAVRELP
ncbi:hypothetical protein [Thiorhodococcus fuscus]|uniref:Uncharacterized protein n=1 Tax=Thiorhodococcus fuscus TaxID=527200 RepID=A0ABW4YBZ5_9GAMM